MNQNQNKPSFFNFSLKFNLKSLLIIILFTLAVYFLIPKLIGAEAALKLILKINKFYLFLAVISEIISYCGAAWLLGIILSRLGRQISFLDLDSSWSFFLLDFKERLIK